MTRKVITKSIFANNSVETVVIKFQGMDLKFKVKKLPGGTKWGVIQDCIQMNTKTGPRIDMRRYYNTMIALSVVAYPNQDEDSDEEFSTESLTPEMVDTLDSEIYDQLCKIMPTPSMGDAEIRESIKKA